MSDIYSKIGCLLASMAPADGVEVIMVAEVSEDKSVATFEYDSVGFQGEKKWFVASGTDNEKMLNLMVELRDDFSDRKDGDWKSLEFKLNVKSGKFSVNFSYAE